MGNCMGGDTPADNSSGSKSSGLASSDGNKGKSSSGGTDKIETKQAKLEDSNMANYGSKEHRDLRKDAAGKEDAWTSMDKGVGIQIWRIEKFKVVAWPKSKYGQFHTGKQLKKT